MELFMFVSGIGTLVLLATHIVDYALDATHQRPEALQGAVRYEAARIGDDVPVSWEVVEEYDRAA